MAHWFISDLHLDADRSQARRLFLEFIRTEVGARDELFILGDLFEAWIGDDDNDPGARPILEALAAQSSRGTPIYFMHGNRDFLVGEQFCQATGCRLLGDYATIDVYGTPLLLTHGDLLCTDDTHYMNLRATVRSAKWQREFLALSLAERRQIAADMRAQSRTEIAAKPSDIMDVNVAAVAATMQRFGVRHLLHGHTHRPAVHSLSLDGHAAQRIVLGAWHEQGSMVRWDARGFALDTYPSSGAKITPAQAY